MNKYQTPLHNLKYLLRTNGFECKLHRRKFNVIKPVLFRNTDSDEPIDEFNLDVSEGHPNHEQTFKNKALYSRSARGYVVAKISKDGKTFVGRSICSDKDKFHGDLGSLRAINNALRCNNINLNVSLLEV